MRKRIDYVIEDRTHAYWPGRLPYRTRDSRQGYRTEEAASRVRAVERHYNALRGQSPGDLRVVERRR
jgi:hypothetical protein